MNPVRAFTLLLLSLALVAVARAQPDAAPESLRPGPVILISMDGFRWDYCTLHPKATPQLRELMKQGISARSLIPVYPSNTFPNHYSIVTGLYPSHHGIVNNMSFDPEMGQYFYYNRSASNRDDRWWGGEPIWVTAVRQGRPAACAFWPGSEAQVKGTRATFWRPYDYSIPFAQRLDELAGWLRLPASQQPAIITFYLEETNSAGHNFGPDSPELVDALRLLDGRLGELLARVRAEGVEPNLVIVSDHGMTACSLERVLILEDYLDLNVVQVDFDDTSVGLRPLTGTSIDEMMQALQRLPPQAKAYRAEELPAHLHVDARSPRVPPVWIVPAEGWQVSRRAAVAKAKAKNWFLKGQHGYDPAIPSMQGLLVAHGPAFKTGGTAIPSVENVHIYNLLCAVVGLRPAPNDGDDRLVRALLK